MASGCARKLTWRQRLFLGLYSMGRSEGCSLGMSHTNECNCLMMHSIKQCKDGHLLQNIIAWVDEGNLLGVEN